MPPRSTIETIGLALIAVPLVLYGLAATRYVPAGQLADPTALTNMTVAIAMLGDAGKWWMGLVSVAISFSVLEGRKHQDWKGGRGNLRKGRCSRGFLWRLADARSDRASRDSSQSACGFVNATRIDERRSTARH